MKFLPAKSRRRLVASKQLPWNSSSTVAKKTLCISKNVIVDCLEQIACKAVIFSDNHCMQLVREGVTDKLLLMLKQPDVVPTVQHAVFSALRNMAIPSRLLFCFRRD